MILRTLTALAALFLITAVSPLQAGDQGSWGYAGKGGPPFWSDLDPSWSLCRDGGNQSPIDITDPFDTRLPDLLFDYQSVARSIENDGRTLHADFAPGSTLTVDGRVFTLQEVTFHSPSEHRIEGVSFPLEAQLVHRDEAGHLAIIAVLYEEGRSHRAIGQIWRRMPTMAGRKAELPERIQGLEFLPDDLGYYRYNGSMTAPPCSEGVLWLVMKRAVFVSRQQVDSFVRLMGGSNSRPVQPLNARAVME